jgi:hypothetical protein
MKRNPIYGIMMRPCFTTQDANEAGVTGAKYGVKESFLDTYQDHLAAMQIVAECAKVYILNNYKKVSDWSGLDVIIDDNSKEQTEYFNYDNSLSKEAKEIVEERKRSGAKPEHGDILDEISASSAEKDQAKHNPILTISECVIDTSDGDFSLKINGKDHLWIGDDSVIMIADYIEGQLK